MTLLRSPRSLGAVLCCALTIACGDGSDDAEELDSAAPSAQIRDASDAREEAAVSEGRDASASGLDASRGAASDGGAGGRDASTSGGGGRDAGNTPSSDAAAPASSDAGSAHDASTDAGASLPGWKLVWADEFDGPAGALPDSARWVFETGGSGFGNNQQEFDTNRAENASLNGMGELVLTARKEAYMGKQYTSARLKTQGKFEHGYGRYESRMRIPFGQGMWPAFWMLGSDIGSANWPACGEIDIMENIGKEPDTVHGTMHGPGYSGGAGIGAPSKLTAGQRFADDYHVFAIEWEKDVIRWYVDGKLYQTRTPKDLPANTKWVYDHSFFLLLNLAVGGQWPGNPDNTTTFPQTLKVDYVRVYDRVP